MIQLIQYLVENKLPKNYRLLVIFIAGLNVCIALPLST